MEWTNFVDVLSYFHWFLFLSLQAALIGCPFFRWFISLMKPLGFKTPILPSGSSFVIDNLCGFWTTSILLERMDRRALTFSSFQGCYVELLWRHSILSYFFFLYLSIFILVCSETSSQPQIRSDLLFLLYKSVSPCRKPLAVLERVDGSSDFHITLWVFFWMSIP